VQIKIQRNLVDKFLGKMAIDRKIADEIIDMEIYLAQNRFNGLLQRPFYRNPKAPPDAGAY
jgi:hypothetical protein